MHLSEKDITNFKKNHFISIEGIIPEKIAKKIRCEFENSDFDLIYSFGVIHHTPNPRKIIKSIIPLMKKNTELRIMLYAKNSCKNFMIECGLSQPEAQNGCPIALTYDQDDVKKLLKEFEIIYIEQDHIFPYQIKAYVKYSYKLEPWFQKMPPKMFSILEKKLGWHLLIKAKLSA